MLLRIADTREPDFLQPPKGIRRLEHGVDDPVEVGGRAEYRMSGGGENNMYLGGKWGEPS